MSDGPVLSVRDLRVTFGPRRRPLEAVRDVSFDLVRGETLALVGESGSGKSTTARALVRLVDVTSGSVTLEGDDVTTASGQQLRELRRRIQLVFQDPSGSLNPRRRVADVVAEPLDVWATVAGDERARLVGELLHAVGLDPEHDGPRFARALSGGEGQRVAIARALAMGPAVLLCDEIVSALDVSVQAQILNLLEDLRVEYDLAVLFITHDLAVVRQVADRVAVMYAGALVEVAAADDFFTRPAHPYAALLLASALDVELARRDGPRLEGEAPNPFAPPSGCRFRTRCPYAQARCASEEPRLRDVATGQRVACHFPLGEN